MHEMSLQYSTPKKMVIVALISLLIVSVLSFINTPGKSNVAQNDIPDVAWIVFYREKPSNPGPKHATVMPTCSHTPQLFGLPFVSRVDKLIGFGPVAGDKDHYSACTIGSYLAPVGFVGNFLFFFVPLSAAIMIDRYRRGGVPD